MKQTLISLLCLLAALSVSADQWPSKMYCKGAWGGGSWTWKEMTTVQDGVYTYQTTWAANTGFNTNTSASSSGASWFPKANIHGYDSSVITDGTDVTLVHSAASATLSLCKTGSGIVVMLLSKCAPTVGDEVTVEMYTQNVSGAVTLTVTDPDGSVATATTYPYTFTGAKVGDYTLRATATDADGAECSQTLTLTVAAEPEKLPFDPTADELKRCYHEDLETHDITFLFDLATWGKSASSITSTYVRGSVNGWSSDDAQKMVYDADHNLYYVTVPYNTVKRPGNSGQPEYKFYINGSYISSYSGFPSDYIFKNADYNQIVIFSFDDIDVIRANSEMANVIKQVSDFDLTTDSGKMVIANLRVVPGTQHLIRTYHPFKWSRSFSTEPVRMAAVVELCEKLGVKSDIVLSGDETGSLTTWTVDGTTYQETIPDFYKAMIAAGNVLYVGKGYSTPSYNEVYYNSTGEKLGNWIKETVAFINADENPVPFTIHCRLGTDRTGVFCATLGALCGASWDEVVADYEMSNRLGTQEFRGGALLRYAFEQMLGVTNITDVPDFPKAVANYFIGKGYLTQDDVDALNEKLQGRLTGIEAVSTDTDAEPVYYNLQGVRVTSPAAGQLLIRVRGTRTDKIVY